MAEYITKEQAQDAVGKAIAKYIPTLIGFYEKIPLELCIAIRDIKPNDVAPVIHAQWKDKGYKGEEDIYYEGDRLEATGVIDRSKIENAVLKIQAQSYCVEVNEHRRLVVNLNDVVNILTEIQEI